MQSIKPWAVFLLLTFFVLFYYLPILQNPAILLNRGNDLQEYFWPVFYFIRHSFLDTHTIPLWNNLFFSGMPLLPDPQFSLFYPPNFLFLAMPTDMVFIVSLVLHTAIGGFGIYMVARSEFGFSKSGSLFTGVLYILIPRLAGYLEAGHFGLVATLAWLPWMIFAIFRIVEKPRFIYSLLLAVSLAGLFYTHTVTFLLALPTAVALSTYLLVTGSLKSRPWPKCTIFFLISLLLLFGLIAIALLPQINWMQHTTRFLLLEDRDVYPKWASLQEFIQVVTVPWTYKSGINQVDTEKLLTLGFLPLFLAFIGFLKLERRFQIALIIVITGVTLVALNNISPLYPILMSQDWYVLTRVSTRIWFIPTVLLVFLAGFGSEYLRKKRKDIATLLMLLATCEVLAISWLRLARPVPQITKFAPKEIYGYLSQDRSGINQKEKFRVFCVNRCLSQKDAALAGLELVDGYNTLQQLNYYKQAWQLTGAYWNHYTLSIPPAGTYTFEKPQPDAKSLGEFNTKYVITPYELTDKNFAFEKKFNDYLVYKNTAFLPRAYYQTELQEPEGKAPIITYTPNHIRVATKGHDTNRLVLSEVWSPGWEAYLNGKTMAVVQEKPNTLRLVDINPDTEFVDFVYEPDSFKAGRIITLITIGGLVGIGLWTWKRYYHS